MVAAVVLLHTIALLAQLGGGWLLVVEARRTRSNIEQYQDDLVHAEGMREKQRSDFRAQREEMLRRVETRVAGIPMSTMLPPEYRTLLNSYTRFTSPENVEKIVNDHGPAVGEERRALMAFLDRQFPASPGRSRGPWPGVVLLFLGIAVSYGANVLSTLYV